MENKLEQIQEETSKSSSVKIQVVEQGKNIDLVHIIAHEDANLVEEKTYKDIGVQMMEVLSVLTNQNSSINKATSTCEENHISKLKEENATSMIRESNVIRNPYRHPNHKIKYINQSKYQYYPRQEPYKHPVSQDRIKMGRLFYNSTVLLSD